MVQYTNMSFKLNITQNPKCPLDSCRRTAALTWGDLFQMVASATSRALRGSKLQLLQWWVAMSWGFRCHVSMNIILIMDPELSDLMMDQWLRGPMMYQWLHHLLLDHWFPWLWWHDGSLTGATGSTQRSPKNQVQAYPLPNSPRGIVALSSLQLICFGQKWFLSLSSLSLWVSNWFLTMHCPIVLRFYNMKKSQRGSIRKAPSAISWVVSLSNIGSKTMDPGEVIKQWILGQSLKWIIWNWKIFYRTIFD